MQLLKSTSYNALQNRRSSRGVRLKISLILSHLSIAMSTPVVKQVREGDKETALDKKIYTSIINLTAHMQAANWTRMCLCFVKKYLLYQLFYMLSWNLVMKRWDIDEHKHNVMYGIRIWQYTSRTQIHTATGGGFLRTFPYSFEVYSMKQWIARCDQNVRSGFSYYDII